MSDAKFQFLIGVLGEEGAKALRKAAQRSKPLDGVILPRTILAWLDVAEQYEGELPGVQNTYLSFTKSESESYSGSISIADEVHSFDSASKVYLASAIAVSLLGASSLDVDTSLRDHDLTNLGKSIDLLAKAHALAARLAKAEPPGPAAAPTPQNAPTGPDAPKKQSRIPRPPSKVGAQVQAPPAPKLKIKIPGLRKVQIAKSQQDQECPACGGKQFKDSAFKGCVCFRDLSKSVTVQDSGDNLILSFGNKWDSDAIATLLEALGVK